MSGRGREGEGGGGVGVCHPLFNGIVFVIFANHRAIEYNYSDTWRCLDICSCPEPTTKLLAESIINFPMAHVFNIKLGFALFTVPIVKWQMMCNFYDCDLYISLMVCGGLKSDCDESIRVICVGRTKGFLFLIIRRKRYQKEPYVLDIRFPFLQSFGR